MNASPTIAAGGARQEAGPSAFAIPAGVPHRWANRSEADVRALAFFAPGGIEEMFAQVGGKAPAEIAALAARYGTVVVGPPLA